jgi:hypothetical protein
VAIEPERAQNRLKLATVRQQQKSRDTRPLFPFAAFHRFGDTDIQLCGARTRRDQPADAPLGMHVSICCRTQGGRSCLAISRLSVRQKTGGIEAGRRRRYSGTGITLTSQRRRVTAMRRSDLLDVGKRLSRYSCTIPVPSRP